MLRHGMAHSAAWRTGQESHAGILASGARQSDGFPGGERGEGGRCGADSRSYFSPRSPAVKPLQAWALTGNTQGHPKYLSLPGHRPCVPSSVSCMVNQRVIHLCPSLPDLFFLLFRKMKLLYEPSTCFKELTSQKRLWVFPEAKP